MLIRLRKVVCLATLVTILFSYLGPTGTNASEEGGGKKQSREQQENKSEPVEQSPTGVQPIVKSGVRPLLQSTTNHKTYENSDKPNWFDNFISGVKWTDILLAAFSGLLVWVGSRQVRYFAAKERAFVFVKSPIFNGILDSVTNKIVAWQVSVRWENGGETPTRYLNILIQREPVPLRNGPLPEAYAFFNAAFPGIALAPALIGPKAVIDSDQLGVGIDEMIAVRDNTQRLYIWGWAEYDDVFPGTPRHRTEFCYRIFVTGDPTDPSPGKFSFRWSLHNAHNGADDECLAHIRTTSPKHRKRFGWI
jgi:hypothetical protein